jgi:hypothetical protein
MKNVSAATWLMKIDDEKCFSCHMVNENRW